MTTEKYCRSPLSLAPTTDPFARRPGCCRQERSSLKERPSLSYVFAGCERHCAKSSRSWIQIENDLKCHLVWHSTVCSWQTLGTAPHMPPQKKKGQDPGCHTGDLVKETEPGRAAERELCTDCACWEPSQAGQMHTRQAGRACCLVQEMFGPSVPSRASRTIITGCFILNARPRQNSL